MGDTTKTEEQFDPYRLTTEVEALVERHINDMGQCRSGGYTLDVLQGDIVLLVNRYMNMCWLGEWCGVCWAITATVHESDRPVAMFPGLGGELLAHKELVRRLALPCMDAEFLGQYRGWRVQRYQVSVRLEP